MVTPADHIRELRLTNKYLRTKNGFLKEENKNLMDENENLKANIDMLKNEVAKDQTVATAAGNNKLLKARIKQLEDYNKELEEEVKHLRQQLDYHIQQKKIANDLSVLKNYAYDIDAQIKKAEKKMALLLLEARVDTNVQQMECSKARTVEQVAQRLREKSI
ncbi:hypothetical protein D6C83_03660 [Aureobasidium pullulans]|uniref:Uncharacterized protein n=1 Tax=Aureobasidium pullulans TaxID=5580 RepID=A0A4T0DAX6_AURPU|nr:hypothetical protein D6C83_03660 [Aureobasidium pullulans]